MSKKIINHIEIIHVLYYTYGVPVKD